MTSGAQTRHDVERTLETVLGTPFTRGNRITPLRNGVEIFPEMLEAIVSARVRIEFLTFVYWTGDVAERFAHALAERARAGVHVRVLLDAVGAREMPDSLVELMREAGIDVEWFRPLSHWKIWEADNRTHRKVLVVDGRIGFTGGVGIAAEWEGDARDVNEWRDTHFRIEGPAVDGLEGAFFGNWAETGRRIYTPPAETQEPHAVGTADIQVTRATASTGWSDIASLLQLLIVGARERLQIASAYFVPDEVTIHNLTDAVSRGVEVDVMMPGPHTDERVSQLAGEAEFHELLAGGVRLWKFQPTMLHTKIMLVDRQVTCIGSANFNQRSMRKDDEVALVVLDEELARVLEGHFAEDLERCRAETLDDWKERSGLQRLLEAVAKPFRSHT